MRTKLTDELYRHMELILKNNPERVWGIGALYDELRAKINRRVTLGAVEKAMQKLINERKVVISWQIHGVQNYRFNRSVA